MVPELLRGALDLRLLAPLPPLPCDWFRVELEPREEAADRPEPFDRPVVLRRACEFFRVLVWAIPTSYLLEVFAFRVERGMVLRGLLVRTLLAREPEAPALELERLDVPVPRFDSPGEHLD